MPPLVSILIPAYNAERWIADTIRSALAQTWPRVEVIVIDDGSCDQTLAIARKFAAKNVLVVSQENQGASVARNKALELYQGDYVQWLDADDILSPDKVAIQMELARKCQSKRTLFSAAWGYFYYRLNKATFSPSLLWRDLSSFEWLLLKMGRNLHMPNSTWLTSRELTQIAGAWDNRLSFDDDGEYFCRVILASDGIRFLSDAKIFYRISGFGSLSTVDESQRQLASFFLSMRLHLRYLRSLEDSERVRAACLNYLQTRLVRFYPERIAFVEELQQLAATLGGQLEIPRLSWKYSWIQKLFGWTVAKRARQNYNRLKSSVMRSWDKTLFDLQRLSVASNVRDRGIKAAVLGPNPVQ